MKRIYLKIAVFVFAIAAMSSCSDDKLLDKQPYDSVSEEIAFDTPENIELSVNGMYEAAAIGDYIDGSGRGYVWGAAWAEQNDARGEDIVNTEVFFQITYLSTYDASSANNRYYWEDGYGLINKANLIIDGVTKAQEEGTISEEEAEDIIGQARFLRAITHFEFLIQFARPYSDDPDALGVPYRDTPVFDDDSKDEALADGGRNTVAEVYEKVLEDLDYAEEHITNTDLIRASSNAAIAFKTRVYLNMRDWDNVINEGSKLEGAYELEAEPSGVFADNSKNTESIFSLDMDSKSNPDVNGALAAMYNDRELLAISPILWNQKDWLKDDKRRAMGNDDESDFVKESEGTLFSIKYKDTQTYTDLSPIIRYAEVKLNMAEAYARKDNLSEALANLNDVRDRALANPSSQSYKSSDLSNRESMVKAILLERRIEFLAEGHRWGDIHRLQGDDLAPIDGIPAKRGNGYPSADEYDAGSGSENYNLNVSPISYDDHRFIWPIPNSELSVNDKIKDQQNPGY